MWRPARTPLLALPSLRSCVALPPLELMLPSTRLWVHPVCASQGCPVHPARAFCVCASCVCAGDGTGLGDAMLGVVVEGGDAGEMLDESVDGDNAERVVEAREGAEPAGFEGGEGAEESKGGDVYRDSDGEEEGEEESEEAVMRAELLNHPAANFW